MNEQSIVWIYIPTYAAAKEQTQISKRLPGLANKNLKSFSDTIWQCCFALDLMRSSYQDIHCIAMIDTWQVMKHLIQAGNELFVLCATLFNPLVNYIIYRKASIIKKKIKWTIIIFLSWIKKKINFSLPFIWVVNILSNLFDILWRKSTMRCTVEVPLS